MSEDPEWKLPDFVTGSTIYQKYLSSRNTGESRELVKLILGALYTRRKNYAMPWIRSKDLYQIFIDSKINCNSTTFYQILDNLVKKGFIIRILHQDYKGKGKTPVYYKFPKDYHFVFMSQHEAIKAARVNYEHLEDCQIELKIAKAILKEITGEELEELILARTKTTEEGETRVFENQYLTITYKNIYEPVPWLSI